MSVHDFISNFAYLFVLYSCLFFLIFLFFFLRFREGRCIKPRVDRTHFDVYNFIVIESKLVNANQNSVESFLQFVFLLHPINIYINMLFI